MLGMVKSAELSCLLLFAIITQTGTQDVRSVIMSAMYGHKFACANTTCLPLMQFVTSNRRDCQVTCLSLSDCNAVSFYLPSLNCALFHDGFDANGNLLVDPDIITMIVASGTRFPPGKDVKSR